MNATPALSRPPLFTPGAIAAAAFVAAYGLIAVVAALARGNAEFLFYAGVLVLIIAAVVTTHVRVRLPTALLWALAIWGALHMAGGLMPIPADWPIDGNQHVLYSWWIIPIGDGSGGEGLGQGGFLKFDNLVHVYGFASATWLCWCGLIAVLGRGGNVHAATRPAPPRSAARPAPLGAAVLAALAGMGLGAGNEVIEFIAATTMHSNVGGYINTGWDLVCNTIGATLAATLLWLSTRRRRASIPHQATLP